MAVPNSPEIFNEAEISNYFQRLGYGVVDLRKPWRHIVGELRKGPSRYFLKLATTEDIAKRTRNEFTWNNMVNENSSLPVLVPRTFGSGEYYDLFYFLSEYVDEKDNITSISLQDQMIDQLLRGNILPR